MTIPSRHVSAVLWLGWLMAAVMVAALAWGHPDAVAGIGVGFGAAFLALGGSAAARHYGAREPSGGARAAAHARPQDAPEP